MLPRSCASWNKPAIQDSFLYPTADLCCAAMLPHLGSACQHYDRRGCGGAGTVPDPPKKTPEPPPPAPLYYVMESSGLCVSDKEVPKPKWIQATFETYRRCCYKAWDKNQCLKDRPCTDDDPCEEQEALPLYYVLETSGVCVSDKEVPKPEWIQATFETYRQCCDKARNKDQCLKDRPCTDDDPCEEEQPPPASTPPTPAPAAASACAGGPGFHPDYVRDVKHCTNDANYPPVWLDLKVRPSPAVILSAGAVMAASVSSLILDPSVQDMMFHPTGAGEACDLRRLRLPLLPLLLTRSFL